MAAARWSMTTTAPKATNEAEIQTTFGATKLPARLPTEANFPRPNLTAVLVQGFWAFESNAQAGWKRLDPTKPTLQPGQHVYLEYNVANAKEWAGVPLPTLRLEQTGPNCVYAGTVHDDQARLRISNDMTTIILRVNGRIAGRGMPKRDIPSICVAQNVHLLEPAGYINHYCWP